MSKKKNLLSTSAIIALTLFHTGTALASEQSEEPVVNQKTEEVVAEEIQELEEIVEETEEQEDLPGEMEESVENEAAPVAEEETVEEVVEEPQVASFSVYSAKNQQKIADQYVKDYQEAYFVSHLWSISQEFKQAFPNDHRVDSLINDAARYNLREGRLAHDKNDFARAIIYYDRVMSEARVASTIKTQANVFKKFATTNQVVQTADELYAEYKRAHFIADQWLITLDFKALYPEDSRLPQMILEVAEKNLAEGRHNHGNKNYKNAISYYNRILDEDLVSGNMRSQVEVLFNFATANQPIKSANTYYKEYQDAFYVSHLWGIAQEFKLMYPNDHRLAEVIEDAAVNNVAEGHRAHRRKDFGLALTYYNRVAIEPSLTSAQRTNLTAYIRQAENNQALVTADDYYKTYQDSFFVSDLWSVAQNFKKDYPHDRRVAEVINDAAENNIAEGQRAHRRKDYNLALIYYNRVLEEDGIRLGLRQDTNVYVKQAQNKHALKTADNYYNEYKDAYFVSDLWNISQAFKNDFPSDKRAVETINDAAENNAAEGKRAHRRNNYELALIYYNRVNSESLVDTNLRAEINTYIKQAEAKRALKTPDDYMLGYENAYFVSDLWSISQNFKTDFPNDGRVSKVVNDAAVMNLAEGKRAHLRDDHGLALIYYNRVLSEERIASSLRSEINTYVKQANAKRALKTPDDYILDYVDAYYVSDLWNISQLFKADFPEESRLIDIINNAAEKNLNEGLNNHRNKNYKNAAIYYERVNSETLADASLRSKAEAYYYLASNNMNLTNTIVRSTKYDISLDEMIDIQVGRSPQMWDTVNGNPFRDATRAEVAKYVNPKNSSPANLDDMNYLLTTLEVNTGVLNVRTGPGTMYKAIGTAFRGEHYTILDKDQETGWYKISYNGEEGWVAGASIYVKRTNVLQHLRLSGSSGISVADLNKELEGAGILEGMGATFRKASQEANVNELYLIAHALLESGHGTSALATGIEVNGRMTYNMFGIGAFDNAANEMGSQRAYDLSWFTPEAAIIGGAKWNSSSYINNQTYKQDTLYKMRWNPERPGVHQYATDVRWAESQMSTLDSIILLAQKYDVILNFDVPLYK